MDAVAGFTYTELRELPLPELFFVIEQVTAINEKKAAEVERIGRR